MRSLSYNTWSLSDFQIATRGPSFSGISPIAKNCASLVPPMALLAHEPQRNAVAILALAQARLLPRNVVPGDRHHALALRHLDLKDHHRLFAECRLGSGEIEFPHAHEALVIEPPHFLPMGEKTLARRQNSNRSLPRIFGYPGA